MKITRAVVTDLWPLYDAGEASADTRALIDEYLSADPEFGRMLREQIALPRVEVPMSKDTQIEALRRTRDLVRGRSWLRAVRLMALVFTIFALMRVMSDTTWTVSPRPFIGNAVLAVICWTVYCVALARARHNALRGPTLSPILDREGRP